MVAVCERMNRGKLSDFVLTELSFEFFVVVVQDYIKQKVLVCHAKPVPDTGRASLVNPHPPNPCRHSSVAHVTI